MYVVRQRFRVQLHHQSSLTATGNPASTNYPIADWHWAPNDERLNKAEKILAEIVRRNLTGQYIVSIPTKSTISQLGNSQTLPVWISLAATIA
jgi:hypothetical protein